MLEKNAKRVPSVHNFFKFIFISILLSNNSKQVNDNLSI
jgi:hypothetical protein